LQCVSCYVDSRLHCAKLSRLNAVVYPPNRNSPVRHNVCRRNVRSPKVHTKSHHSDVPYTYHYRPFSTNGLTCSESINVDPVTVPGTDSRHSQNFGCEAWTITTYTTVFKFNRILGFGSLLSRFLTDTCLKLLYGNITEKNYEKTSSNIKPNG